MRRNDEALARLKRAQWLMRPETQRIMALLDGQHRRARAVGGAVRDTLLGLDRHDADIDIATELTPGEVVQRADLAGIRSIPTGIAHGTVTLVIDSVTAEVTTLREDVETDGRHALVRFGGDWRLDAARRDFTLNALYADMDGTLFDPLEGLADCLARRVRFIGDADRRIAEDRLRVFRFFRFSASHAGETLDRDGLEACRRAAGTLDRLALERVGREMCRMLALPRVARTLKAMVDIGIVSLPAAVLPLLHSHERQVRKPTLTARLALLLTGTDGDALQEMWRLSNDDLRMARNVLAVARLIADFRLHEAAYRHPGALGEGIGVAATLAGWTEAGRQAVTEQLHAIEVPRFPVHGGDLVALGMRPGPAVGERLDQLEKLWIASGFTLARDQLLTSPANQ